MVTITLHDLDAIKVLTAINYVIDHAPHEGLSRAREAFECALLLCDCDKRPAEVLRMEREPRR